jgi:methyltransferase
VHDFLYQVLAPLLVALTALQRIIELLHSRSNQRSMHGRGFARVDSQASYLCMVIVHATWFVAMISERLLQGRDVPLIIFLIALGAFILAQGLRLWAIRSLGSQWNVQVMTPTAGNPDPGVVASGPYRYIRHPNYLAVILEFLSLPLLLGAPYTALIWSALNAIVLYFRIRAEESHLMQRPDYQHLFHNTPRLIPSLLLGAAKRQRLHP